MRKKRVTEDALKVAEMRKRSLETFTESQNRNNEEITPKRTRDNDNDTTSYLTAKCESEFNLRKERGNRNNNDYYPTTRSTSECSRSKSTIPTSSYVIHIT